MWLGQERCMAGANRVTGQRGHRRGVGALAAHVADDERPAAVADLEEVVEVAPDLARARRPEARRDLEPGDGGEHGGQEAVLQRPRGIGAVREQARVVERQARAPSDLDRDLEIGCVVGGHRSDEAERRKRASPGDERGDDQAGAQLGLSALKDGTDRVGALDVVDRHLVVDQRPIGDGGHGEPHHGLQGGLVVQALRQRHRHLDQEALRPLARLLLRDILEDVDRHGGLATRRSHRARLDDHVAVVARGAHAKADRVRGRLAGQRSAPRQAVEVIGPAVDVEELEARQQVVVRCAQKLLGAVNPIARTAASLT